MRVTRQVRVWRYVCEYQGSVCVLSAHIPTCSITDANKGETASLRLSAANLNRKVKVVKYYEKKLRQHVMLIPRKSGALRQHPAQ